ncbi:hypothetical protein QQP08_011944 [Theobroma cacao]|nr:hypothetical protein QQP08_011944 [Theobroma cacao]
MKEFKDPSKGPGSSVFDMAIGVLCQSTEHEVSNLPIYVFQQASPHLPTPQKVTAKKQEGSAPEIVSSFPQHSSAQLHLLIVHSKAPV